jgi:uncharacterized protein YdbL (DUF1318 family)
MKRIMGIAMALVIGVASVSFADALSDAKERRKERKAAVEQLLKSGAAEEADTGFLRAKNSEEKTEGIVKAENADRKIAFEAIAKKTGANPVDVAKQAAASRPDSAAKK